MWRITGTFAYENQIFKETTETGKQNFMEFLVRSNILFPLWYLHQTSLKMIKPQKIYKTQVDLQDGKRWNQEFSFTYYNKMQNTSTDQVGHKTKCARKVQSGHWNILSLIQMKMNVRQLNRTSRLLRVVVNFRNSTTEELASSSDGTCGEFWKE